MSVIKVLYIVSTLEKCGPTNQLFYIVKNLDRKIFDPYILKLSSEPTETRIQDFIELGIKIFELKSLKKQFLFKEFLNLKKIINEINPNIIHTQGIRAQYYTAKIKNKNIKKVITIRNFPYEDFVMEYGKIKGYLLAKIFLLLLNKFNYVVSCSNAIKERFKSELNISTISIQNAVDIEKFLPVDLKTKKDLRIRLDLPCEKRIFISTGLIIFRKNPELICKVFQRLGKDNILLFLGEGNLLNELKANYENSRIKFLGRKTNVHEYLQASDYFVSSSLSEGLPNSVLEALACGIPVLLSDIPSHLEFFKENKKIGYTFKNNDENDFLLSYERLINDDYYVLSKNCTQLIKDNFNGLSMSQKYQSLYLK